MDRFLDAEADEMSTSAETLLSTSLSKALVQEEVPGRRVGKVGDFGNFLFFFTTKICLREELMSPKICLKHNSVIFGEFPHGVLFCFH